MTTHDVDTLADRVASLLAIDPESVAVQPPNHVLLTTGQLSALLDLAGADDQPPADPAATDA